MQRFSSSTGDDSALRLARQRRRELTTRAWRETRGRPGRIHLDSSSAHDPNEHADVLAVDHLLVHLEQLDPIGAALCELRFFGGLDLTEAARELGRPREEVEEAWVTVRAWFRERLSQD